MSLLFSESVLLARWNWLLSEPVSNPLPTGLCIYCICGYRVPTSFDNI